MAVEDSVADDLIKAFVDRIIRLKGEVKALNADIREIYGEAKGSGLDKTILGKVVNYVEKHEDNSTALQVSEATFDLYLTAYFGVGTRIATHTHEAVDRVSGEIIEHHPGSKRDDSNGEGGHAEAVPVAPIQPETVEQTVTAHELVATSSVESEAVAISTPNTVQGAGKSVGASASAAPSNVTPLTQKPLRPHCLKPELCGGQGKQHCWKCLKAMNEAGAA